MLIIRAHKLVDCISKCALWENLEGLLGKELLDEGVDTNRFGRFQSSCDTFR